MHKERQPFLSVLFQHPIDSCKTRTDVKLVVTEIFQFAVSPLCQPEQPVKGTAGASADGNAAANATDRAQS